ncbi:dTMP kinase [Neptuniibacter sp. QD37_11]|uniref:dTMP kinase n=1 Tax=Neptuniibacter sp. QD37_11 TaxID=3398209 RepID=UPI0039F57506
MTARGKLTVFEGVGASGKTTQIKLLSERLKFENIPHIISREPGGTQFAEELRSLLLKPTDEKIFPWTEALLFFAARNQHVENVIKPALARGEHVILDRFVNSTYAIQCFHKGVDLENAKQLSGITLNGFKPDKTVLLDIPFDVALDRMTQRERRSRFDVMQREYLNDCIEGHRALAHANPEDHVIVYGHGDKLDIHEAIWTELQADLLPDEPILKPAI